MKTCSALKGRHGRSRSLHNRPKSEKCRHYSRYQDANTRYSSVGGVWLYKALWFRSIRIGRYPQAWYPVHRRGSRSHRNIILLSVNRAAGSRHRGSLHRYSEVSCSNGLSFCLIVLYISICLCRRISRYRYLCRKAWGSASISTPLLACLQELLFSRQLSQALFTVVIFLCFLEICFKRFNFYRVT